MTISNLETAGLAGLLELHAGSSVRLIGSSCLSEQIGGELPSLLAYLHPLPLIFLLLPGLEKEFGAERKCGGMKMVLKRAFLHCLGNIKWPALEKLFLANNISDPVHS